MKINGLVYIALTVVLPLCTGALLLHWLAPGEPGARSPDLANRHQEYGPVRGFDRSFAVLAEAQDPSLQMQLEGLVRKQGLWEAVENGELALLLAIVTDPARPRMAELNGHRMMYAASLPKIAILFGAAVSIEQGRLRLTRALHNDLVDMIRESCNDCATRPRVQQPKSALD